MYVAAVRIADTFGCDAIGIQYQQGLKDLAPASDLVEGTLNCSVRPPVARTDGSVIRADEPITHFNEVDECAGLDGLITHRVWTAMGMQPDNTLHDLRWGDDDASGTTRGVRLGLRDLRLGAAHALRQRLEGRQQRAPARDVLPPRRRLDQGREQGRPVRVEPDLRRRRPASTWTSAAPPPSTCPPEETQRRLDATTPQWPIMHAVTHGVSRDQMMAKHQANHIQLVYADSDEHADRALAAKAAMAAAMGISVNLCGEAADGTKLADKLGSLA